jgi:hypothetical protein
MNQEKEVKIIASTLSVLLMLFTTSPLVIVQAKTYAFAATISPIQVNVDELSTYLVIIYNTGESNLGSVNIGVPTGFVILSPATILNPPTSWNYVLSNTSISLSADGGGSVILPGENVTFTFDAIAPASPGVAVWTAEAFTGIEGGGVTLTLEGEQPAVTVVSASFIPPTLSASPTTINRGQVSLLTQLSGASGGTPPYTYQWLEAFDGGMFSPILGANGSEYVFSPTTSTPTGTWSFQLNVTDSSSVPVTVTSNTVYVIVNPALVAPEVTATPDTVTVNQSSILNSSLILTGTSPYTYQWFQKAPGEEYTTVGDNSSNLLFPGSTIVGNWEFIVQVTDGTGASVNSSAVGITVSSVQFFSIIVIQSAHGTIYPGTLSVSLGDDPFFTIMPDVGYHVADVLVDGISVGAIGSFCFVNVTADHSLSATFAPVEFAVAISKIGEGSIVLSPNQVTYSYGEIVELTAIPASGWRFSVWAGPVSYSLNPLMLIIDGNKDFTAIFLTDQYTISASAGSGGSISPSGITIVDYGGSQHFTIIPELGYHVVDVLVNGESIGAESSYTISGVTGDTTISASFGHNIYSIAASANTNGYINPHGIVSVVYGGNQSFTISPYVGYQITDVLVDGISVGAVSLYNFTSVTSNHTITANFGLESTANSVTYAINVISSRGEPTPSSQVNAGEDFFASVTSPEGDTNQRWICTGYSIDGSAPVAGVNYTFVNVQADHTITFHWQKQYYLTAFSPEGSTTGTGWYNAGTTATISVTSDTIAINNGTRRIFAGWTGNATGADTRSAPITIDSPKTATAVWITQCQVIYTTSGNSLQVDAPPAEWVNVGTQATGTFPESIVNSVGNIRDVLVSENRPIAINETLIITGFYQTLYLVTFSHNGLDSDASGIVVSVFNDTKRYDQLPTSVWINAGDSITFSYVPTIETGKEGKKYILTSNNFTSPLIIEEPTIIQGIYHSQLSTSGLGENTVALASILVTIPSSFAISMVVWRRKRGKKSIKPIANEGGVISPSIVQKVEPGGNSTVFIITADAGYKIEDVVIDDKFHLGVLRTHKFVNVTKNHTISAIFHKE